MQPTADRQAIVFRVPCRVHTASRISANTNPASRHAARVESLCAEALTLPVNSNRT
jgi:hypothetical protein